MEMEGLPAGKLLKVAWSDCFVERTPLRRRIKSKSGPPVELRTAVGAVCLSCHRRAGIVWTMRRRTGERHEQAGSMWYIAGCCDPRGSGRAAQLSTSSYCTALPGACLSDLPHSVICARGPNTFCWWKRRRGRALVLLCFMSPPNRFASEQKFRVQETLHMSSLLPI
jgi:hypothetical protein